MDFQLVGNAVLALVAIGLIASAALAVASRRFHVEVDALVEGVLSVLPGSNCGACGSPSCFSAAEAMASGGAGVNACVAGGQRVADAIADALGLDRCEVLPVVSARQCGGGTRAERRFDAAGVRTCDSVHRLAGGDLVCPAGCLGYGDCVRACPFNAMSMDARGLPLIDPALCTGCGVCVKECPRGEAGLLVLAPETGYIVVRCNSHDRPKPRKAYCAVSCISCKKCEKECPSDAIHVIDFLAVVDHDACTACGRCVVVCPQKCIDVTGARAPAAFTVTDGAGPEAPGFVAEASSAQVVAQAVPDEGGSLGAEDE